jgi:hypothetical protein
LYLAACRLYQRDCGVGSAYCDGMALNLHLEGGAVILPLLAKFQMCIGQLFLLIQRISQSVCTFPQISFCCVGAFPLWQTF